VSLARFRELFVVGNPDAFAVQNEDGSYFPHRQVLTDAHLKYHAEGLHTLGVYTVRPGTNDTKLLVWDFDNEDLQVASNQAAALVQALVMQANMPWGWLMEFSGRKGYHVWLFLEEYMPADVVRRAGLAALQLAGLPLSTEVYPKQTEVTDLGNLIKLPLGKHQVSGAMSRFVEGDLPWQGVRFTSRKDIVNLAIRYHEPPRVEPAPVPEGGWKDLPPCMQRVSEQGVGRGKRDKALLGLAVELRKIGLDQEEALERALQANSRFDPPLQERIVRAKVASAYGHGYQFTCSADYLHDPEALLCSSACPRQAAGPFEPATDDGPPGRGSDGHGHHHAVLPQQPGEGEVLELVVRAVRQRPDGRTLVVLSSELFENEPIAVLRTS
jgi:TOTE conflict system, Archaeo-Eukaryotic Primase domain/Primase C terminal 1 (PriCT-1)